MQPASACRRAFTAFELIVLLAVVIIAGSVLVVLMKHEHRDVVQLKDTAQLRGVMQGFIVWAQNNNEDYPNPAKLDKDNMTTAEVGSGKNHSGNIWSLLVFNGFVPLEMLVSPEEISPNIAPYTAYEFNSPKAAANPSKAQWDPAFPVDFTGKRPGVKGGVSYAHNVPTATRQPRWSNKFQVTQPVISNRGPEIASVRAAGSGVEVMLANPASKTLRIHGESGKWKGYVIFNDNHADTLTDCTWTGVNPKPMYTTTAGSPQLDIPFYNEPDDANDTNVFMGLFTTAGDASKDFNAIWD